MLFSTFFLFFEIVADVISQFDVFVHHGLSVSVECTNIRVFKETDKIGLSQNVSSHKQIDYTSEAS